MKVVALFVEGFPSLSGGRVYDVVYETENYVTIIDNDNEEYSYPKAIFCYEN